MANWRNWVVTLDINILSNIHITSTAWTDIPKRDQWDRIFMQWPHWFFETLKKHKAHSSAEDFGPTSKGDKITF